MRKKELLGKIPKRMPEHDTARVVESCGESVLMLILPEWQKRDPAVKSGWVDRKGLVHFVWAWGYLTYYTESGTWTNEGYDWLEARSRISVDDFDKRSNNAIGHFTGRMPTAGSIGYYEQDTNWRIKRKYEDNRQRRIDALMAERTPALPRDFEKWCGSLTGKPGERVHAKLFQKCGAGHIERMFEIRKSDGWHYGGFRSEDVGKVTITEICRAFTNECGGPWREWYYGEHPWHYGKRQRFWHRKNKSVVTILPKRYVLYDNLGRLELSPAERSCARIMDGSKDPADVIWAVRHYPELETLIKSGLGKLVTEIMSLDTGKWLDRLECLKREQLKRLARYNGGTKAWELLKLFPEVTDQNLKDFCNMGERRANEVLEFHKERGLNINHLFALWRETGGLKKADMDEYKDYLDMAAQRGNDIKDGIIYRNKRWREFHDRYVEERNAELERQRKAEKKAKADKWKGITRDYRRNTRIFGWEKDGYCIIVPKSAEEINEEGRKQHHCVGANDRYKTRMAARTSYIVFLRKAKTPGKPYYTIEVDKSGVVQYYAAYDRQPDKDKVKGLLAEWMVQVRKNLAKEEKKKSKAVAMSQQAG